MSVVPVGPDPAPTPDADFRQFWARVVAVGHAGAAAWLSSLDQAALQRLTAEDLQPLLESSDPAVRGTAIAALRDVAPMTPVTLVRPASRHRAGRT